MEKIVVYTTLIDRGKLEIWKKPKTYEGQKFIRLGGME